jgi:hypothetical protein
VPLGSTISSAPAVSPLAACRASASELSAVPVQPAAGVGVVTQYTVAEAAGADAATIAIVTSVATPPVNAAAERIGVG